MHRIRIIGRLTALLAGLTGLAAWAASGATPALAAMNRIPDGDNGSPQLLRTVTRTVVVGGMPGWQIALIVVGAAAAASVAVLFDRTRAARQPVVTRQHLAVPHK